MSAINGLLRKHNAFFDGSDLLLEGSVRPGGSVTAVGGGKVIYVDPANGADTATGRTPAKAVQTVAAGYAKLTANQNDILVPWDSNMLGHRITLCPHYMNCRT